ncbi:hypothetical protein [Sporomusa aerivorans]|uniref:hypothetical protein n=1 Tax=Sporomusa aerivorans TaxID=204936 RepID=UPI003529DD90
MKEENVLIDKIEADWVIVEVVDKNTGQMFRRNLPVGYLETDNGIVLTGEAMDGTTTHINFLSEAALAKINDLLGKGPDKARCDTKEDVNHV